MLAKKLLMRLLFAMAINLGAVAGFAETLQIQLRGNVASSTNVTISWEEFEEDTSCNPPCPVSTENIVIRSSVSSQGDEVGAYNLEIPDSATRICIQGDRMRLNIDTTVLYMNNRQKKTTRRGGNVNSNGSAGCSDPYADVNKARVWVVNLL